MSKMHPLHTPDSIAEYMRSTGEYFPVERRTGRSTAQALKIIAEAIRTPHKWVQCLDHNGTESANRMLQEMVRGMVFDLRLEHFQFRGTEVCFGVAPRVGQWSKSPFPPMAPQVSR